MEPGVLGPEAEWNQACWDHKQGMREHRKGGREPQWNEAKYESCIELPSVHRPPAEHSNLG